MYYMIGKQPVFISLQHYKSLNDIVLRDKSVIHRMGSHMEGHPTRREADELRYEFLVRLGRDDPAAFYREWVYFDFREAEASSEIWDLLYDYCCYRRCGYLSDVRDTGERLISDLTGDPYSFP